MSPASVILYGFMAIIFGMFLIVVGLSRKEWSRSPAVGQMAWQVMGQPETVVIMKPSDEALKDYTIEWKASATERAWTVWYRRYANIDFHSRYLGTADTFEEAEKLCVKHKESSQ